MPIRTHLAGVAAGGLLAGLALVGPAPAQAADSVTTITRLEGVKLLACKVPTDGGDSWFIRDRVQNKSDDVATASMTAYRNGNRTRRAWQSGDVRPHSTSRPGGLTIPRGVPGWTLLSTLAGPNAGNGNERPIGKIGRC